MESTDSSTGSPHPNLPPGFRFHPTDEELVVQYLKKKATSAPLPVAIVAEVDLYKFDPWELPAKATFGEKEWYFFSPRDRKYPNGARPNRAATSGYWKATGTDKPVLSAASNQKVGVKKALVFYGGKPPKGIKTNWIMHEYRLVENKPSYNKPPGCDLGNKKNSLRLDDWVLCRIYKKNNTHRPLMMDHEREDSMGDMTGEPIPPSIAVGQQQNLKLYLPKATTSSYGTLFETDHHNQQQNIMFEGIVTNDHHHGINNNNPGVMSQLLPSSSCKPEPEPLPMFPALSGANSLPLKRTLPASLYWNDEDAVGTSSSKRLHLDDADGNGSTSFTTLLTQTPSMHQQAMLGSIGDGLFRVPGLSWYS